MAAVPAELGPRASGCGRQSSSRPVPPHRVDVTDRGAHALRRSPHRPHSNAALASAERDYPASGSLTNLLSGQRPAISGSTDIGLRDYVNEILASGFPALRGLPERELRAQLNGYLQRIVDREFPEQGMTVRHPDTLRAWMRAYAAATSTTASFEVIRDAATPGVGNKPAKTTTLPWRDILTRLWLLDPLPAWLPSSNRFKELASAESTSSPTPRSRDAYST